MAATLTQTINLGIQIGILLLVIGGYTFFKDRKFIWHAQMMTIGFTVILISFLLVMIPSIIMTYNTFLDPATFLFDTASIVHIPIGATGIVMGAFLVIRWARNDYRLNNMKSTRLMRATLVNWVANVLIGATIYFSMPS